MKRLKETLLSSLPAKIRILTIDFLGSEPVKPFVFKKPTNKEEAKNFVLELYKHGLYDSENEDISEALNYTCTHFLGDEIHFLIL
jgi:hypothetical protein